MTELKQDAKWEVSQPLIERVTTDTSEALKQLNKWLKAKEQQLLDAQEKAPGALTVKFKMCGPGCSGCPHPQWRKWYIKNSPEGAEEHRWRYAIVKNPKRLIWRDTYSQDVREIIEVIIHLLDYRSRLIKQLATLNRTLNGMVEHEPELLPQYLIHDEDEEQKQHSAFVHGFAEIS